MIQKANRIGKKFLNNKGHSFEIIEYNSASEVYVKFTDGTICKSFYGNIIR